VAVKLPSPQMEESVEAAALHYQGESDLLGPWLGPGPEVALVQVACQVHFELERSSLELCGLQCQSDPLWCRRCRCRCCCYVEPQPAAAALRARPLHYLPTRWGACAGWQWHR